MKKFLSFILALSLLLSACLFSACSEIEKSSKIQRMLITLDFYDAAGEVVDTKTVQAKLYLNFAPQATERFIALAEDGYFDNTCVSNVQSGYFEFGGYEYVDGKMTAKAYDEQKYPALKGEFEKNGWIGNKLTTGSGAILFKHDKESTKEVSKYDTAKGSIVVVLENISKFDESEYCVFGVLCSDDQDDNPESSVSDSQVNRTGLSSLGVARTLPNLAANDGVTTYYNENNDKFYTRVVSDGETEYYEGTEVSEDNVLTEDSEDFETLKELIANYDETLLTIPYTKVIIRSVKKK